MTTLFERLVGSNLQDSDADPKIGIHAFSGAINELHRGKITGAKLSDMFSLDSSQQSAAIALKGLIDDAPNKVEFMRVFKDWLYLGEARYDSDYVTQSKFVSRLQDEVVDQGGTVT